METWSHEDYSLFACSDDLHYEKDYSTIKQEMFRQRIYIEELLYKLRHAEARAVLERGNRYAWDKLMWRLIEDYKQGNQTKEEFIAEFQRIRRGASSI